MVGQIYPTKIQLIRQLPFILNPPFLAWVFSITKDNASCKIYDRREYFNFEIVNFPFLDGDVPRSPSYSVYISQPICFARICPNVSDFNNTKHILTNKLLKQVYRH